MLGVDPRTCTARREVRVRPSLSLTRARVLCCFAGACTGHSAPACRRGRTSASRGSGGCETATGVMGVPRRAETGVRGVRWSNVVITLIRGIFNQNGRIIKCKKYK
eukprot:7331639-Prymnesium_polylepis.1